jgi:hypothetical protein
MGNSKSASFRECHPDTLLFDLVAFYARNIVYAAPPPQIHLLGSNLVRRQRIRHGDALGSKVRPFFYPSISP